MRLSTYLLSQYVPYALKHIYAPSYYHYLLSLLIIRSHYYYIPSLLHLIIITSHFFLRYVHLGGDEVNHECWETNEDIMAHARTLPNQFTWWNTIQQV